MTWEAGAPRWDWQCGAGVGDGAAQGASLGRWRLGPASRRSPAPSGPLYSVQGQLTCQVEKTQERCPQTLFIFDEAEKLHPELLEALRPHLEGQAPENPRGESRRTIFLFLR